MTEFQKWVAGQDKPVVQLAAEIGCHRVTLYAYLNGKKMPRPDKVEKIKLLTGGLVTAEHLTQDYAR